MRLEEVAQAKFLVSSIKKARTELENLQYNEELTEFGKQQREYELSQVINLLKSDAVDLVERMLNNPENKGA